MKKIILSMLVLGMTLWGVAYAQVETITYEPIFNRVTVEFPSDVTLDNSSYGIIYRNLGGRAIPCYISSKGSKLFLQCAGSTLLEGEYTIHLSGVSVQSGDSVEGLNFNVVYNGLVPITQAVFTQDTAIAYVDRWIKNCSDNQMSLYGLFGMYGDSKLLAADAEKISLPAGEVTHISQSVAVSEGNGKHFLWDSADKISPIVPKTSVKAADSIGGSGNYIIEYTMPLSVKGSEMVKSNFTLTHLSNGKSVDIDSATYFPLDSTVKLIFTAKNVDNSGMRLDFESQNNSISDLVFAKSFFDNKCDIAVTEITCYAEGRQIYQPMGNDRILVLARVENKSGTPCNNVPYSVVSSINNSVLYESTVSLPAEGSNYICFSISKSDWLEGETIEFVFNRN